MDLSFTPEQEAFREEVKAWIATSMPDDIRRRAEEDAQFSMEDVMRWHKLLHAKGWVAPHWPEKFGGPGFDAAKRFILTETLEMAGAPQLSPF